MQMFTDILFFASNWFLDSEIFWGTPILLAIAYALVLLTQKAEDKPHREQETQAND
tara:strand:- start:392 stop:559 length:168 start_codon:yes stop_codon:yes gene_type:complete